MDTQPTTEAAVLTSLKEATKRALTDNPALRDELTVLGTFLNKRGLSPADKVFLCSHYIAFLAGLPGVDADMLNDAADRVSAYAGVE